MEFKSVPKHSIPVLIPLKLIFNLLTIKNRKGNQFYKIDFTLKKNKNKSLMLLEFPVELIYSIIDQLPYGDILELRKTCKLFYYDKSIMRGIEERKDYHQYIHDQYFVIMLGFNYLPEYNRLKIINDMAIIKYLQPLYRRLCCFFKLILKKQYHINQLPLIEFQEYQKLIDFEEVRSTIYAFDKRYPIKLDNESYKEIRCNCKSRLCQKMKYNIEDFNLENYSNLSRGCQKGYQYIQKYGILKDNLNYRLIEELLSY